MTELEHKALNAIAQKKGLWFLKFWAWPSLIRTCKTQGDQLFTDLEGVREALKNQQQLTAEMEAAARSANEAEHRALNTVAEQRLLAQATNEELGNAKTQVQQLSETVGTLENRIARGELETERIKAELSKTEAELARARLDEQREKDEHKKTRRALSLAREFIHTNNRIDLPARRGIRAALQNGVKRFTRLVLLFFPLLCISAPPPPFWHNSWSTNRPPMPVEGLNNLSVTNLGSGTNWQFYNVGPFTVARLTDVSNIAGGAGLTFADLVWTNDQGIPHVTVAITNIGWSDTNTFITRNVGGSFTEDERNLGVGYQTGNKYTSGDRNSMFGNLSGSSITIGDLNSGFGWRSMTAATDGANNSAFGARTLEFLTVGSQNSAFGLEALQDIVSGTDDCAFGYDCLDAATGSYLCGYGSESLHSLIAGDYHAAFGYRSGFNSQSTGGFNTFLGALADHDVFPGTHTNSTAVGFRARFTKNNQVVLGNPVVAETLANGHIVGLSNLWLSSTGLLGGLVATQDIRFLGHNSTSNFVWTCTNSTTGEGEWRVSSVAGAAAPVTNVVSLSTTNATSKPITNHFENGILTLYGLEAGANISLSDNGSNIVITGSAGGSGLTTNENQFLGVPLSIKSGAQLTNVTFWESNALLPALIATNQPGGTIDLVTMLTTNSAGLRVTSNGAVVVRGVIGSTTNSFEVRRSNNAAAIFGVTHSNTVRIIGPSQTGYGATLVIQSEEGSTQNNIELYAGSTFSGRWRSDSAGNQIISAGGTGELQLNYDDGSGRVAFGVPGIGNVWYMVPSASVAAWHAGTSRRGQISNVWDVFVRSNVNWTEVGGSDRVFLQSTSGMSSYTMFLPITNGLAGQVLYNVGGGELSWKDDATGGSGALFNPDQFLPSATHTNIKSGAFMTNMNFWGTGTNHGGDLWIEGDVFPEGVDHFLGNLASSWSALFTRDGGVYLVTDVASGAYTQIKEFSSWKPTNSIALTLTNVQAGEVLKVQSVSISGGIATILVTNGVDNAGGGGLTTNANQFGASVELTLKSGALMTNTLFYPSNLTGPAIIGTATTEQVTNLVEWRSTNGTIPISISSNANAIVYGRLDMSNAVAFRTNNIDFRLPIYQAFTNALQTNLVLQLTNTYEGVTHRIDAYGAGRLGNGRTNAWQLLCTVASGTTIYWPPGTTNGNFDVLVNSNQVVSLTFSGGLGSTNIIAEYRIREAIGAN